MQNLPTRPEKRRTDNRDGYRLSSHSQGAVDDRDIHWPIGSLPARDLTALICRFKGICQGRSASRHSVDRFDGHLQIGVGVSLQISAPTFDGHDFLFR